MKTSNYNISRLKDAWIEGLTDSGVLLNSNEEWQYYNLFNRFTLIYKQLAVLPRHSRRSIQRKWRHSLAGIALLMVVSNAPVIAETITVDSNCSLIDAITSANTDTETGGCKAGNGSDVISLPFNSFQTLSDINNIVNYSNNGLPKITSEITIQGNSSTIERSDQINVPDFRLIYIESAGDLTLLDTTISGGRLFINRGFGGGILNDGNLTLVNSKITGNYAYYGGGGISSGTGSLTISNSIISNNSSFYEGSGISTSSETTLTDSVVMNNISTGGDNADGGGGGIFNRGSLSVNECVISGNTATRGGGISNYGDASVIQSTISNNSAIYGGGGVLNNGQLELIESTFTNNTSLRGGGIQNENGTVSIINSTVSHNSNGGIRNNNSGRMNVSHCTVTANTARTGGGIFNRGMIKLERSIVSGNVATSNNAFEIRNRANGFISSSLNLLGNDSLSNNNAFNDFTPDTTDIVTTSDGNLPTSLGQILDTALNSNGGPTQTHALVPGSPAIDAVTDNSCPPPAIDQRGVERPQNGDDDNSADCDIGAYEFQLQAMLNANIDFKPGNKRNPINPKKKGGVWVALLSDTQTPFDPASQVDISTILLGPDGAEVIRTRVRDINKDGVGDLLLRFMVPDTGIMCGDTKVTLSGETFSGDSIQGTEFIQTKGCKKSNRKRRK